MKRFEVDVDITMSCRIEVDAESEEQAKTIVGNWIGDNPWQYVRDGHYMSHEFEAVNESEPDNSTLGRAVRYIRENMDGCDLDILKAEMNQCYEAHLIPDRDVMDCDKVIDLLEEFGEENGLPECWWESECDFDEILAKI